LWRFVRAARPDEVQRIARTLSTLLANSMEKHVEMLREIGAPEIIRRTGQLYLYPDENGFGKMPCRGPCAGTTAFGWSGSGEATLSRSNRRSAPITLSVSSPPIRACRSILIGRSRRLHRT